MPDGLKKILQHELDELKQNKIRATALGVCFMVLLIFWATDDSSVGEEISLNEEPPAVDTQPATKDLPVVNLPTKSPDGVTLVLGANADPLFVGDPFAGKEKPKPAPPPPKVILPPIPPATPQPQPQPSAPPQPQEKITLTGTAISGENKTAMFLRGKETLFLTVGEEINGKKISDITPDFVTFADGERIFIQKGL